MELRYNFEVCNLPRKFMKTKIDRTYTNRGRTLGWGSGPDADWKVMFSFFLVLIILSAVFSARLFLGMSERLNSEELDGALSSINIDLVKSTSSYYQTKNLEFGEALQGVEASKDPSI